MRLFLQSTLSLICLLALSLSLNTTSLSAQNVFNQGDGIVNIGIALGGYGYANATSLPAIGVSYDHGLSNDLGPGFLSAGGIVGFKTASYDYGADFRSRWTNIFIGARGLYHWDQLQSDKYNVYGGLVLGLRYFTFSDSNDFIPSSNSANLFLGGVVGGRYMFTPSLGAFAELGYSIGYATIGVSLKL